ncbi:MAG: phosphoribosylanthranilate isomerase [Gemmatimonadota bacterium]
MAGSSVVGAKICGVTRAEDAALAVAHGAVRVGVVFAGGPREVSVEVAREIVAAAGAVPVLAVVRPGPVAALIELARATGVRGLQLHGKASDHLAASLRRLGLEVWRQVALREGDDVVALVGVGMRHADAILIEPRAADGGSGGRGLVLDREVALVARGAIGPGRMVLAGGLSPESVRAAIRRVQPDLVDVSSGVESAPGIKDPGRLMRFLEAVRDVRSRD